MGAVMPLSDAGPMSLDARRRRTAGLMAAQFDRPTPQDTEVVERSSMLPLGVYANGMTGPAIPGFIYDGLMAPGDALSGKLGNYQDNREEWAKAGFDAAGSAMVGGLAGPRPRGSVGMGGRAESTGAALNAAGERQGIRAYHGSPHDFDKFDLSKIGTGEGAQAYGHGLYFAENEGVARSYKKKLSAPPGQFNWISTRNPKQYRFEALPGDGIPRFHDDTTIRDFLFDPQYLKEMHAASRSGLDLARRDVASLEKARDEALANVPERYRAATADDYGRRIEQRKKALAREEGAAAELDAFVRDGMTLRQGRMYEVRINASPDDFLDWDKPLSQQSEKVYSAVNGAYRGRGGQADLIPDKLGWNAIDIAFNGDRVKAAQSLREAGIPGIKYLDQGSRTAGEGSRNYVVFDDNLVEILRKYGLLGMIGGGGMAAVGSGSAPVSAPMGALPDYRGAI